jgi:hypothetical protein
MAPQISPTQSDVQEALVAFLTAVLPTGGDCAFVGSIDGDVMMVTKILNGGTINPGDQLNGVGVAPGTTVESFQSSAGGTGTYFVEPSQTLPQTTMGNGVAIIAGQQNRAAEPAFPSFVVLTPIAFTRLETNLDESADVRFQGSISGNVLTVSQVFFGQVGPGALLFGSGVAAGTSIVSNGTGPGLFVVSVPQTLSSRVLSCGATLVTQGAQVTVQIDFHSADLTAGDMAQTVSTLLRDPYGVDFFAALAPPLNGVVPLYADDPKQVPFVNAEQQYEWRWTLDAQFQVNQTVSVPQQYADAVEVGLVSVP